MQPPSRGLRARPPPAPAEVGNARWPVSAPPRWESPPWWPSPCPAARRAPRHAPRGGMPSGIHPRRKVVQREHAGPAGDVRHGEIGTMDHVGPQPFQLAAEPHSHQRRSNALRGPPACRRFGGAAAGIRNGRSDTRKNSSSRKSPRQRQTEFGCVARQPAARKRKRPRLNGYAHGEWGGPPGLPSFLGCYGLAEGQTRRSAPLSRPRGCHSSARNTPDKLRCARAPPRRRWRDTTRWFAPARSRNPSRAASRSPASAYRWSARSAGRGPAGR